MTNLPLTAARLRGTATTTLITATFAALWGISGSLGLQGLGRALGLLAVALITLVLAGLALRLWGAAGRYPLAEATAGPNPFETRSYRLSVLAMVVAIPAAARLLALAGRPDATMAAVVAIVGLHFLGLVGPFKARIFAVIAGAMVLLALLALLLVDAGARTAVLGLGAAAILWLSSAPVLATTLRDLGQRTA